MAAQKERKSTFLTALQHLGKEACQHQLIYSFVWQFSATIFQRNQVEEAFAFIKLAWKIHSLCTNY